MFDRRVTIIPRVAFQAWDALLSPNAPAARVVSLKEALETTWRGETLALQYAPKAGDVYKRLASSALVSLKIDGEIPFLNVGLFDLDHEGHTPPPPGWAEDVLGRLPPPLKGRVGWYRTPNGMRIVVLPREPVALNFASSWLKAVVGLLVAAGIPVDPTTDQWQRPYFLPQSLKRDLPRDFSQLAPLDWEPPLEEVLPSGVAAIVARSPEEFGGVDYPTKTSLAPVKKVSARLADALAGGIWSVMPGERHRAILGAACIVAQALDTRDPLVIWAHISKAAVALVERARGAAGAAAEVMRACEWAAAHWAGHVEELEREAESSLERSARAMGCGVEAVRRRLILDAGQEFFVWNEAELTYAPGLTNERQLWAALRDYCPTLAGYLDPTEGKNNVFARFSTPISKIVYTYAEETRFDEPRSTLYLNLAKIDPDLTPRYDHDVAAWLKALGGEHHDKLLDWLACVPDRTKPLAALYLNAEQGVGKEMFVKGLARLWSRECLVTDYETLLGQFQAELRECPLIVADETVPQAAFKEGNESSIFRRIVGKSSMTTNAKFRAPATVTGSPVVVITANNDHALQIRETLTPEDLAAVEIRLGYIRTGDQARTVLKDCATARGFGSPREMTAPSWVEGGKVAEHVLWLAHNRTVRSGDRFWVEGWESELTRDLAVNTGGTGQIVDAITSAIVRGVEDDAVRWFGDHVYVSSTLLGGSWERLIGNKVDKCPSSNARINALRALSGGAKVRLDRRTGSDRSQGQYWAIPVETIARVADGRGLASREDVLQAAARSDDKSPVGPTTPHPAPSRRPEKDMI
jgi:hypothetical protein